MASIFRSAFVGLLICAFLVPAGDLPARAQQAGPVQPPPESQTPAPQPQAQPPAEAPPPPPAPAQPAPAGQQAPSGGYSISVTVPEVNVDVVVTDNNGTYLPGLKRENFRVYEDNVPQTVTSFAPTEAPITIVLLVEFSELGGGFFSYNGRNWARISRPAQTHRLGRFGRLFDADPRGRGLHPQSK